MAGLTVLTALDSAKIQYYHFKAIIIAGMGLFTDAYDFFCIAPVTVLLGHIYYDGRHDIPAAVMSALVGVALLGAAVGQVVFGYMGDIQGRRKVYGLALGLMVVTSIGSGFSICSTSRTCVMGSLGLFRFLLGVGIGGDYPLSATIMSEFANQRTRGAFIAAVFSMQGFGILFSAMVSMTVCAIFDRVTVASPEKTPKVADLAWRVILMIGAIPAAVTFYWRMKMPETARYTALVQHNVAQAVMDMEKVLDISITQSHDNQHDPPPSSDTTAAHSSSATTITMISTRNRYPLLSRRFFQRHGRDLFSCAATWFLLDVVFYSSNFFQSHIYDFFLPEANKVNAYVDAYNVVKLQAIVAVCSTIPGYWVTVFCIDRIGRRKIQIMGFMVMALGLFAIGGPYSYWNEDKKEVRVGFMVLYGLTFFFSNFGPNTTTFIVPAELFPARFRTTCHGIAGAAGKVGAIVGSIGFLWANRKSSNTVHNDNNKDRDRGLGKTGGSLLILAAISGIGAILTYFFTTETMGRSLEENEKDPHEPQDPA